MAIEIMDPNLFSYPFLYTLEVGRGMDLSQEEADRLREYIVRLMEATREPARYRLPELTPLIEYGASPRAGVMLARAVRAHAFIAGREYALPEDVKELTPDVLRHRIIVTYEAEAEEVTSEEIVRRVLDSVPVP